MVDFPHVLPSVAPSCSVVEKMAMTQEHGDENVDAEQKDRRSPDVAAADGWRAKT